MFLKKKLKKKHFVKKNKRKLQQSNLYTTKKNSPFGLKMAELLTFEVDVKTLQNWF